MTPDSGLVLARFVALAAMMSLSGLPLYLLSAGQARLGTTMRLALAGLGLVAALASAWWAAASVAAMAAMPLGALDRATLLAVLEATPMGMVLLVRLAAIALALACLALSNRTLPAALLALVALATSAWTGHSGALEGTVGMVQRGLDVVHLAAAALWLGALIAFLASLAGGNDRPGLVERLSGFARTGTFVVVALALTGSANALLIGREGWSPASSWSLLLTAKVTLFLAMLGLAAINRWRLTPALAAGVPGAEQRLRRSLALETGCALGIVALVAVLGLLDPAGG